MLLIAAIVVASALAGGSGLTPVTLTATDDPFAQVRVQVLDNLTDGDVLAINVIDGSGSVRGVVQQCRLSGAKFDGCRNAFTVVFDEEGHAVFQYRVDSGGACGPTDSCVVVVDDLDGRVAWAHTVFGAPAPAAPGVALVPAGPFAPGDPVDVVVGPTAAGSRVDVAFCGESCGTSVQATAGADGMATARLAVGDRCSPCGVRVLSGAAQAFVAVTYVPREQTEYDRWRVIAGLALAIALAATAWWLIRTTDWRPPSEAATPELDDLDESSGNEEMANA